MKTNPKSVYDNTFRVIDGYVQSRQLLDSSRVENKDSVVKELNKMGLLYGIQACQANREPEFNQFFASGIITGLNMYCEKNEDAFRAPYTKRGIDRCVADEKEKILDCANSMSDNLLSVSLVEYASIRKPYIDKGILEPGALAPSYRSMFLLYNMLYIGEPINIEEIFR